VSTTSDPPTSVLAVRGLAKRYGDAVVFGDVDLEVERGEFVAVVGESGVGKSTLLNCIAALDGIDAGSVRILDVDIASLDNAGQMPRARARSSLRSASKASTTVCRRLSRAGNCSASRSRARWSIGHR